MIPSSREIERFPCILYSREQTRELSSVLERTLNHKETALVVFLNIEGAFDKVPITTAHWIKNLLSCRYIYASLGGDDLTIHASAGCL